MAIVGYLKQSTAATIKVGPMVDDTDGKTAETALTLSQADFRLSKNGGDFAQKNESSSGTHDEIGYYDVAIDTTDTNTLGRLTVAVHESGALPVRQEYSILPGWLYDSWFTANGPAPAYGIIDIGTAQSATATTLVLRSGITVTDDVIIGGTLWVYSSTNGLHERRIIKDWVSSTDTATVDTWTQTPTGTILYVLFASPPASTDALTGITANLLGAAKASYNAAGTIGEVFNDIGAPVGASISADIAQVQTDVLVVEGKVDIVDTNVDTALTNLTTLLGSDVAYQKNVAVTAFAFPMQLSNGDPGTGLTVTGTISKDGGAFSALGAAVSEIASGWYKVNIAQAEMNADEIALKFTATGARQLNIKIRTQS